MLLETFVELLVVWLLRQELIKPCLRFNVTVRGPVISNFGHIFLTWVEGHPMVVFACWSESISAWALLLLKFLYLLLEMLQLGVKDCRLHSLIDLFIILCLFDGGHKLHWFSIERYFERIELLAELCRELIVTPSSVFWYSLLVKNCWSLSIDLIRPHRCMTYSDPLLVSHKFKLFHETSVILIVLHLLNEFSIESGFILLFLLQLYPVFESLDYFFISETYKQCVYSLARAGANWIWLHLMSFK